MFGTQTTLESWLLAANSRFFQPHAVPVCHKCIVKFSNIKDTINDQIKCIKNNTWLSNMLLHEEVKDRHSLAKKCFKFGGIPLISRRCSQSPPLALLVVQVAIATVLVFHPLISLSLPIHVVLVPSSTASATSAPSVVPISTPPSSVTVPLLSAGVTIAGVLVNLPLPSLALPP